MTASEYLKLYGTANAHDKEFMRFAVKRTEDGMAWMNAFLRTQRNEDPIYCIPEKMSFTGEQIMDILQREVKNTPSLGDQPYGVVILYSLRSVFPCPPQGLEH
jgi:hypothetical protein